MVYTKEAQYPNGKPYLKVYCDCAMIGVCDILPDGFIPLGCRKIRDSKEDAIRVVLKQRIVKLTREIRWLRGNLAQL